MLGIIGWGDGCLGEHFLTNVACSHLGSKDTEKVSCHDFLRFIFYLSIQYKRMDGTSTVNGEASAHVVHIVQRSVDFIVFSNGARVDAFTYRCRNFMVPVTAQTSGSVLCSSNCI